jgi:hypothetical protein
MRVILRYTFLLLIGSLYVGWNSFQPTDEGYVPGRAGLPADSDNAVPDGETVLTITSFGVHPGSNVNAAPAVAKALEALKKSGGGTLIFPEGRYDFWPDRASGHKLTPWDNEEYSIGIFFNGTENCTLEGNGSEFVFHGKMVPLAVSNSTGTTLRNFSIDWDRPHISQAVIRSAADDYLDIEIDKMVYPYSIENGRLVFTGEDWESPVVHYCLFDGQSREILYLSRDNPMGNIFNSQAEELSDGLVRLYGKPQMKPPAGTYAALYSQREAVGIGLYHSKNSHLSNIKIHHSMGSGLLAFFCENITMLNVNVEANLAKDRVFSSQADATYFPNCRGLIRIENCTHTGQTDDWANFRGTYTTIKKISGPENVEVAYKWAPANGFYLPGDTVTFLDTELMQRGVEREVRCVELLESGYTRITFTESVPGNIDTGFVVENMTWVPEVEVRNCTIPRQNRARGILLSTPRRAVIEDNLFRTAGSAILIEGDIKDWFEAGGVTDLLIRRNVFEDCLSSAEPGIWNWGEAVICITPSHQPASADTEPYHRNIRIEDNIFRFYDYPLLYARSVRGLKFRNNRIIRTNTWPQHGRKVNFYLDGCREVEISGNAFDPGFPGRNVEMHHMVSGDLSVGQDQNLKTSVVTDNWEKPAVNE